MPKTSKKGEKMKPIVLWGVLVRKTGKLWEYEKDRPAISSDYNDCVTIANEYPKKFEVIKVRITQIKT